MYCPEAFEGDLAFAEAIVAAYPLGLLVAATETGLLANPIPMIWQRDSGHGRLIGHVALANDLHRLAPDDSSADLHRLAPDAGVMAAFQGPQGYISPQWYPSKAEHHRHVPTWNYACVQLHGSIRFSHEEKAKRAVVGLMTKRFEAETHGAAGGWRMADAPADYMAQMLSQIVAFEITVARIETKGKLSQNRAPEDFAGAAAAISPDLAALMRSQNPERLK